MPPLKVKKGDWGTEVASPPSSMAPKAYLPNTNPTMTGEATANIAGIIIFLGRILWLNAAGVAGVVKLGFTLNNAWVFVGLPSNFVNHLIRGFSSCANNQR